MVASAYYYTRDSSYLRLAKISGTQYQVHFPDGSKRLFVRDTDHWSSKFRPAWIEDAWGNRLTITHLSNLHWRLSDPHRSHDIYFVNRTIDGQTWQVVDRVELAKFGGGQATYSFRYVPMTVDESCYDYNPTVGSYNVNTSTGPPSTWILGTYSETSQTEGSTTAKQQFCFDANTGALLRQRVLKGSSPGSTDVVTLYNYTGTGNRYLERWYGADTGSVGTGALCSTGLGTERYRRRTDRAYGGVLRSKWITSTGSLVLHTYHWTGSRWTIRDLDGKVLRDYRSGTTYHYHPDHLGTPRLITNQFGNKMAYHAYYPYGKEATYWNQDSERMKFTGHERDFYDSGDGDDLDYQHARYYNFRVGRYLSVDPLEISSPQIASDEASRTGFAQQQLHPQRWNRYSYAWQNPMTYKDATGADAAAAYATISMAGPSSSASAAAAFSPVALVAVAAVGGAVIGTAINSIPGVSESIQRAFDETIFLADNNRHRKAVVEGQLRTAITHIAKIAAAGGPGKDPDHRYHQKEIKTALERAKTVSKRLREQAFHLTGIVEAQDEIRRLAEELDEGLESGANQLSDIAGRLEVEIYSHLLYHIEESRNPFEKFLNARLGVTEGIIADAKDKPE